MQMFVRWNKAGRRNRFGDILVSEKRQPPREKARTAKNGAEKGVPPAEGGAQYAAKNTDDTTKGARQHPGVGYTPRRRHTFHRGLRGREAVSYAHEHCRKAGASEEDVGRVTFHPFDQIRLGHRRSADLRLAKKYPGARTTECGSEKKAALSSRGEKRQKMPTQLDAIHPPHWNGVHRRSRRVGQQIPQPAYVSLISVAGSMELRTLKHLADQKKKTKNGAFSEF